MKAIVYERSKLPNPLVLCQVDDPIPKDNEVLIKVFAVSLNAADYRSMQMRMIPKSKIFGADIAGRVESIGKNVKRFKVGDEVVGDLSGCGFGGLAEYTVAAESVLVVKPSDVSFENAAAIPMASVTALQALRNKGEIKSGQKVLICGAGGGVGTFAVQLAKNFGAQVTAVCGEKNVKMVQSIGADTVIDYMKEDFSKSGKSYDLILAINGKYPISAYKRVLVPGGRCVMVGGALSQVFKFLVFGAVLSIGSKKMKSIAAKQNTTDLESIMKLVKDGKIKPVIDRRYTFEEAAEAMRYLVEGHAGGKVVITVINETNNG